MTRPLSPWLQRSRRMVPILLCLALGGCQLIGALLNLGVKLAPLVMLVAMEEDGQETPPWTNDGEISLERALLRYEQMPPRSRPTLQQTLTQIFQTGKSAEILLISCPDPNLSTQRIVAAYDELRRSHRAIRILPVRAENSIESPESFRKFIAPHQDRVQVRADTSIRSVLDFLLPIHLGRLASR